MREKKEGVFCFKGLTEGTGEGVSGQLTVNQTGEAQ